jgi:hypothetical protein
MAKISTYNNDGTVEAADKLIGTDGSTNSADTGKTKNYTVAALRTFMFASPSITGLADYADDTAAAAGNVPVNGLYRTGSVIKIRVS